MPKDHRYSSGRPARLTRALCAAALLLGVLSTAPAAADTLGQWLEQAWQRHPEAQALQARQQENSARREAADSLLADAPAVAVGYRSDQWNDNQGQREWELELELPLWLPGERSARRAHAGGTGDALAARAAALRLELAGRLREGLWDYMLAREQQALAQRRLQAAEALEADIARRVAAGDLARSDRLLAQQETLTARGALLEQTLALEEQQRTLWLLAGTAPGPQPAEAIGTAPALEQDPRLEAARHAIAVAQAEVALAAAVRRAGPELALISRRERGTAADPYHDSLGLRLRLPLSSTPRAGAADAAAQAALTEALLDYERLQRELTEARQQAGAAHQAAQARAALATQAQALAEERQSLAEKAFQLGELNLIDLLRARNAAHEATALSRSQTIAVARAGARLNQAHGILP